MVLSGQPSRQLDQWMGFLPASAVSFKAATDEMLIADQLFRELAEALRKREVPGVPAMPDPANVLSRPQALEVTRAALRLTDDELATMARDLYTGMFGELPPIPPASHADVLPHDRRFLLEPLAAMARFFEFPKPCSRLIRIAP